ncbi:MAG: transcriptional repressor [Atopobiaceae bacterium]|nr:transcriptional repressor [Atopobiaceae bacterium]
MQRGRYRTHQRELVSACLEQHANRYLTVDEVLASIAGQGEHVGRTTAYRNLEAMAADGDALKVSIPGREASYRFAADGAAGQLVCLSCGAVLPLDCHMANGLAEHILDDHAFRIDPKRTVLYGTCATCMGAADAR